MADFRGFIGPSYEAAARSVNAERLFNWYLEEVKAESEGARTDRTLMPVPGLRTFATPPVPGEGRGQFSGNDRNCAVIGDKLYEVFADGTMVERPLTRLSNFTTPPTVVASPLTPALEQPHPPIVEQGGIIGSTVYGYKISATNANGHSVASIEGTISTGYATLGPNNFNHISWDEVTGATGYEIYRTTGPDAGKRIGVNTDSTIRFFQDVGQVGTTAAAPTVDTSAGTPGSTVYGYQVAAVIGIGVTSVSVGTTVGSYDQLSETEYNIITWEPITNAQGYRVYRYIGPDSGKLIGEINDGTVTEFHDTGMAGEAAVPPASNTTETQTIGNDGAPVSISSSGDAGGQLFIVSAGAGYIFDIRTNVFARVLEGATFGGYLDGYFVALDAGESKFKISKLLNGMIWDDTEYAQRLTGGDRWLAMAIHNSEVWLVGSASTEVWMHTGAPKPALPFAQNRNIFIEKGIAAPFTLVRVDQALFWLERDEQGGGMVVMTNGYNVQRVSTLAIESALRGYQTIADAEAWTYQDLGHTFYVLSFPSEGATWCFDTMTGRWHQRGYWAAAAKEFSIYRPRAHTFAFSGLSAGYHLVLDRDTGTIYEMTLGSGLDVDSRPIRRVRRAAHVSNSRREVIIDEIEFGLEPGDATATGDGSEPTCMLRISNDGGYTWGHERWINAGKIGEYIKRVRWHQLGASKHPRTVELVVTDPVPLKLIDAQIAAQVGTVMADPVPVREPVVDLKTGLATPTWISWFNRLSGPESLSPIVQQIIKNYISSGGGTTPPPETTPPPDGGGGTIIAWEDIDTGGSSLGDLEDRDAGHLTGNLNWPQLPKDSGDWVANPFVQGALDVRDTVTVHGAWIRPGQTNVTALGAPTLRFTSTYTAELVAATLASHGTSAAIGGDVRVGIATRLSQDLSTGGGELWVEHDVFAPGDTVRLAIDGLMEHVYVVTGPFGNGPYRYTLLRTATPERPLRPWHTGDAAVRASGPAGVIDLIGAQSPTTAYGPTIVGSVLIPATTWDYANHVALGNLRGRYGYTVDTQGLAAGNGAAANLVVDHTNGVRIRHGNTIYARMVGGKFTIGNPAGDRIEWDGTSLLVNATSLNVRNDAVVSGNLTVSGHGQFQTTLTVTGAASLNGGTTLTGYVTQAGGTVTLNGTVDSYGGIVSRKTGVSIALQPTTPSPAWFMADSAMGYGYPTGRTWRFGCNTGYGSPSTFDIVNESDNIVALSIGGNGNVAIAKNTTISGGLDVLGNTVLYGGFNLSGYRILYVPPGTNTLSAAVSAMQNGDCLMLGAGTYTQSFGIYIPPGVIRFAIIGQGAGVTNISYTFAVVGIHSDFLNSASRIENGLLRGFTIINNHTAAIANDCIKLWGRDYNSEDFPSIRLDDIAIIYGAPAAAWDYAIRLVNCKNATLNNIYIRNSPSARSQSGIILESCMNCRITNSFIIGTSFAIRTVKADDALISGSVKHGCEDICITNTSIFLTFVGLHLSTKSAWIKTHNVEFSRPSIAGIYEEPDSYGWHAFDQTYFDNDGSHDPSRYFALLQAPGTIIRGCHFVELANTGIEGILCQGNAQLTNITDNHFRGFGDSGHSAIFLGVSFNKACGNVFQDSTAPGFDITVAPAALGCLVTNNLIDSAVNDGSGVATNHSNPVH